VSTRRGRAREVLGRSKHSEDSAPKSATDDVEQAEAARERPVIDETEIQVAEE
jgi:hypothetical protein